MADIDLCKLEDVKAWANIAASTPTADALLTRLITAVSRDFMTAVDRHDLTPRKGYIEVVTIDRRNPEGSRSCAGAAQKAISVVGLRHWPIQAITSVTIDGTAVVASDGTTDGFFYDENEEDEARNTLYLIGASTSFNRDTAAIVVYDAGYNSVPEDIEQAVIEWVVFRYRTRDSVGQTSKHLNTGESIQYSQLDMPATTKAVIERYSRNEALL
jgi:hypothetical protein